LSSRPQTLHTFQAQEGACAASQVSLPKTVEIKNARLSIVYHLLMGGAATFLIGRLFLERIYLGQLAMDKHVDAALWVNGVTADGSA
jgi:hypothetical protein